jgi:endonuclease/exonuclease/phosphatase family metal-dependent hydrolase
MRILTYNIHGWRTADGAPNLDGVAQVIAAHHPDVVGLNEVYYPRPDQATGIPALATLAQRLDMHYVFGPCMRWPAQDDMPADAYGNALLSRYPILASAAHHLSPVPDKEQRGLLEARLALPNGRPFTVYVTHLDHTDESARVTQLRSLRTWTIRDRSRPHVVMGDFNALAPWDFAGRAEALAQLNSHPKGKNLVNEANGGPQVVMQMEKAGYVDAYAQVGAAGAQTFIPADDPPIRIDYLFLSAPLAPALVACRIVQEPAGREASDHRPVWIDLDLDRIG